MSERLFHSNVSIASGNHIYLERPQIDRLLEKAAQNPVVIVCAGAGYGKTHSVYSFVRKYDAAICWIQFSERDNISERFWENFVTAVSVINKKAAVKLARIDFPETERQFERYLEIARADTPPAGRCVFVYDDFHLINNKAVLRFIECSITASFPTITSILIARNEPAVNLVKLESKGLLGRITEEDLRFSREELVEYFRLQNIRPSPQTVSSVYHDTEGWAFAIHLAGLSLKNAPTGAGYVPQAMRSNIFKLIESEIMSVISEDLRKFLIRLSLIAHLVPDLLREIAAGRPLVEEMEQIGSFIRFDAYLNAYQIHHLFLDYLSGKQHELSDEEKREVYQKAASWCAQNNHKLDAINYYEKVGDYERLIDVVRTMPSMLQNHIARMLLEILERAPEEIYDRIAVAQVIRTGLYFTLEMFEKAEEELVKVIARLETLPPSPVVNQTLAGCCYNLGFLGLTTSPFTRNYNYAHYFERSKHYFTLSPFEMKPPISVFPLSSYICRVNSEEKEEMEKCIEGFAATVSYVPAIMGGCTMGLDDLARGELAFFRGDLSAAEQITLKALESARKGDQYEIANRALFYLLRLNLARGNYKNIQDIFEQLEAQLSEQYYLNRFTYYDIVTGWYYSQIGQTCKLAPWLKNDFEESDLNSLAHGLELLVRAKYHCAERRYPTALAVLESREDRNSRWAFVLGKIEKKTLESVCRYQNRDREGAFAVLETAYNLALPNALFMPFTEMGKYMRTLTDAAIKDKATAIPREWLETVRRNASGYAKKLFAVAEQERPSFLQEGTSNQGVNLSPRESEVLMGLYQGMTREEIAGISSLSTNTVKSVIRSIYNKLGAVNKADAIRIAVSLGLV
ncbi:MAG: LuxR C-terminal-related transcriptional regulator [Treponema sp.]|jgi:LuxR family maltose regulon positive regulatory protein|nr:LuxR C-terminal-related transcriptional regulator [Treponema sp.]